MHTTPFKGAGFCLRLAACAALLLLTLSLTLSLAPAALATPITVIASFNVTNGQQPMCGVTFDAAGNMYGTTYRGDSSLGSTNPNGVVWKIAHGTNIITDLVQLGGIGFVPANPYGNVAVDAAGNIYGTVSSGSANGNSGYGGVFEIAAGSGTLTDIGDFAVGANPGQHPLAGVARDAAGNLFGTTSRGSTNGSGTIWEIPAGGTLTTIASFLGTVPNGSVPLDGVTLDSQGNLYGTCQQGGTSEFGGAGTVWELPHGSHTVVTLAEFNQTNGYAPTGDVAVDAAGNVYGTATGGGSTSQNAGVVWEVKAGTNTITDLATFAGSIGANTTNGYDPSGNVVLDGAGNLFGTTTGGGTSDFGTVWEIPKNGTLTTIASFSGQNGASPYGNVMLDAQGNLFGTTARGGLAADAGVIWEMVGVGVPVGGGGGTPVPTALTLTPNPAYPDTTINGTVTFSRSVPAGTSVAITRNGSTSLGSIATLAAGTSLAFTLPLPSYLNGSYTIGATLNGQTATQTLTVIGDPNKPVPISIVFSPNPVAPGATITGTITLSGPAPAGGLNVEIFENGTDLGSIPVAAGASTTLLGQTLTAGTYAYAAVENGVQVTTTLTVSPAASTSSTHSHLLWTNTNGTAAIWTIAADGSITSTPGYGPIPGWTAKTIADGADGKTRLLWTRSDGMNAVWTVNTADGSLTSTPGYGPIPGWNVTSLAVGPDNRARLQWKRASDGLSSVWTIAADGSITSTPGFGPYGTWTASALAVGYDGLSRLLWGDGAGRFSVWSLDALSNVSSTPAFGPIPGWTAGTVAGGPDLNARLLLNRTDGGMAVWTVSGAGTVTSTPLYGPISGWNCHGLAVGPDALSRVLWSRSDGMSAVWTLGSDGSIASTPGYGPIPGWSAVALSAGP